MIENSQPLPDYPRGITFEQVWAALMEDREQLKLLRESQREYQKEAAEQRQKEAAEAAEQRQREAAERQREAAEAAERQKKFDLKFERLSENVGGLGNSIGSLIEILIAAHLWEKFPEYDLQRAYRRIPVYDENNKAKTDIDILLVNTEYAMVVEVKSEFDNKKEVDRHIKRMERILQYPPKLIEPHIKILSAIAGGMVTSEAASYAHECGFFVLELTGESVARVPAPPDFKPKEW